MAALVLDGSAALSAITLPSRLLADAPRQDFSSIGIFFFRGPCARRFVAVLKKPVLNFGNVNEAQRLEARPGAQASFGVSR